MAADELDAAALLAAYDATCVPNEARRDRVLARLLRPGARAVFVEDRRADTAALARAVALAVAAAVLAVLGLELATGARTMGRVEQERYEAIDAAPEKADATAIERGDEVHTRGAAIVPTPAVPPVQPVVQAPVVTPMEPIVPRQSARGRMASRTDASAQVPAVDPERALLDEARAAIDRQAWREATAALRRHAKDFPSSALADEREALHIVVDCQLDPAEVTRARRRGTAFVVRHPGSELSRMVIGACRQETPTAEAPAVVDPFADGP